MYEQLKPANLGIVGIPGFCLTYVRKVFGVGAKYPTALNGWENAVYKHAGETPPTDVDVPVWFSWADEGHVGVSFPGRGVYSVMKAGVVCLPNVTDVATYIRGTYLGWSEDIDGVRVVQPTAVVPTEEFYTAVKGDNLSVIAVRYGITLAKIEALNPQVIAPKYIIQIGEKIRVK
jgi:LysM repeat protein